MISMVGNWEKFWGIFTTCHKCDSQTAQSISLLVRQSISWWWWWNCLFYRALKN